MAGEDLVLGALPEGPLEVTLRAEGYDSQVLRFMHVQGASRQQPMRVCLNADHGDKKLQVPSDLKQA
jgi:hypothetical protein